MPPEFGGPRRKRQEIKLRVVLPLSDREKRWGWAILGALLLCLTLPYAWAWFITPQGLTWGGLLFSTDDQNVHLTWARQARDGAFFMRDLFTTEGLVDGTRPLFFNGLMLVIGWLSRLSGLEVVFWYHVVRVAGAAWALWQLHLLSWQVTGGAPQRENARLGALALAAFTTGAGFLVTIFSISRETLVWIDRPDNPTFSLMPEAFFYLSALIYPLNIVSLGLLLLVMRHIFGGKWWPAALGALALSNIHTYDALPLMLIALIWGLANFKEDRPTAWRALSAFGGAALPVAYQLLVFSRSDEFRTKALTPTPILAIGHVLVSYSPLLILAILGWFALKGQRRERNLITLWVFVTLGLVYQPLVNISFSRKMIEGWQLPLLVLGGAGLATLKRPLAMAAVVAILALSPIITTGWILNNAANNNAERWPQLMPLVYLHDSDVEALGFIERQPEQGAVLCLPFIGGYLPRATGKYTYAGHWAETLYMDDIKRPAMLRYFSGQMPPDEARSLFRGNQIRWIIEGPFERAAAEVSPSQQLGLTPVFTSGTGENATVVYATGIDE